MIESQSRSHKEYGFLTESLLYSMHCIRCFECVTLFKFCNNPELGTSLHLIKLREIKHLYPGYTVGM